jgi:hypothetical protein
MNQSQRAQRTQDTEKICVGAYGVALPENRIADYSNLEN